ncbi:hypothetical protein LINPERHAP2_LOCUS8912 [Linum perenne]
MDSGSFFAALPTRSIALLLSIDGYSAR